MAEPVDCAVMASAYSTPVASVADWNGVDALSPQLPKSAPNRLLRRCAPMEIDEADSDGAFSDGDE